MLKCYLNKLQNARCNDKDSLELFIFLIKIVQNIKFALNTRKEFLCDLFFC